MAIKLVPHDPDWADTYERAAADIRGALGSTALSVDHVGSTAILGIVAKPVIDVEISSRRTTRNRPIAVRSSRSDTRSIIATRITSSSWVVRGNSVPCASWSSPRIRA